MVSYLLSVEEKEQTNVQNDWISRMGAPYHYPPKSREKESTITRLFLTETNTTAICANSIVLVNVVIKHIELYYSLCINTNSQDNESRGISENFKSGNIQMCLIREGMYELVIFGLQKLKDGIDRKEGGNFLYEITMAIDDFPLGCSETITKFKKQKDRLMLHSIIDNDCDLEEQNNKNLSILAKQNSNVVEHLTAIEQQRQLCNIIQQTENKLTASRTKHDALLQEKRRQQERDVKSTDSSRKILKKSQHKTIWTPLQNIVTSHLNVEFNQSTSFIQKL
eukprot:CAMPEP_0204885186 /NCGR_PEP_ID=MMETSP1349-20130617/11981_1 /ASSEMBLY_ACC=CAM_ASM_000710 /TAXON_ID=215587 /ORGANISM="Aplanochytrium stocchinoi, Strain GSBS06" /LENGTH=279 /DNA_ID=CAMNT_0052046501 /DNA_START=768 /DNA_END=1604 /DNA_ORIENTATION=+